MFISKNTKRFVNLHKATTYSEIKENRKKHEKVAAEVAVVTSWATSSSTSECREFVLL